MDICDTASLWNKQGDITISKTLTYCDTKLRISVCGCKSAYDVRSQRAVLRIPRIRKALFRVSRDCINFSRWFSKCSVSFVRDS